MPREAAAELGDTHGVRGQPFDEVGGARDVGGLGSVDPAERDPARVGSPAPSTVTTAPVRRTTCSTPSVFSACASVASGRAGVSWPPSRLSNSFVVDDEVDRVVLVELRVSGPGARGPRAHHRDERHADEQGGAGRGGPARVAHGVRGGEPRAGPGPRRARARRATTTWHPEHRADQHADERQPARRAIPTSSRGLPPARRSRPGPRASSTAADGPREREQRRAGRGPPRAPTAGASAGAAPRSATRGSGLAGRHERGEDGDDACPTRSGTSTTGQVTWIVAAAGRRGRAGPGPEARPGRARVRATSPPPTRRPRGSPPPAGPTGAAVPCRRPTQRSSASVRVRWATSTWKVFAMTSAATSRATAANPSTTVTSMFPPPENSRRPARPWRTWRVRRTPDGAPGRSGARRR